MSAVISTNSKGQAEMMYVGQKPWHGLGTELPKLATAEEAIKAAHLDWKVVKRPIFFQPLEVSTPSAMMPIADKVAIVREDSMAVMGIGGKDWMPLQNKDAFSFADAIVQDKAAIYETAGALHGGKKVWLLAKLKGICRVKGDDTMESYLLLANSHEPGHSLRIQLTTVRVVCQNTLSQAINSAASKYLISHTASMANRVKDAREALGLINIQMEELAKQAQRLAEVKVTKSQVDVFAEAVGFNPDADGKREKTAYDSFIQAFETSPGANMDSAKGTLWGLVNGVTYMVDHGTDYKATKNLTEADRKLGSIWFGRGDQLKTKALTTALAMAK